MEEFWDALVTDDIPDSPDEHSKEQSFALSLDARLGSMGGRTIQFHGSIHGSPVIILVDSGSSASFLADSIASKLPLLKRTPL
jgi:hypothetical protein